MRIAAVDQGLTLVHFSAQPQPLLVTEATASDQFSAQPRTLLTIGPANIGQKSAHVQPKSGRLQSTKSAYVELKSGQV